MEALATLLKTVLRWPARYFLALGATCAEVLWLSTSRWATSLGLNALPELARLGLTIGALSCFALWIAKASYVVQRWLRRPRLRREIRRYVGQLNQDELTILLWHVLHNNRTVHVDYTNQVAHGLRAKGILEYAGGSGHVLATPHFISDVAWDALAERMAATPLAEKDRAYLMGLSERDLYQIASPMRRQLGF
jgi:Super-infection exclusion protein B